MKHNKSISKAQSLSSQGRRKRYSVSSDVSSVKTSISDKAISKELDNFWEHHIILNLNAFARDASLYYTSLYFQSFEFKMDGLNILLDLFCKSYESIVKYSDGKNSILDYFHLQLILHLVSITKKDENPNDKGIYFAPNLCSIMGYEIPEPEPPSIIAPLIEKGFMDKKDTEIFLKNIFLGVDPSKVSEERIKWKGPLDILVAWLSACYINGLLFIPEKNIKNVEAKKRTSLFYLY